MIRKRIPLLLLVAAVGVLSGALAFGRDDDDGPYRVVFTTSLTTVIRSGLRKAPNDFWECPDLSRVMNQLAKQGYDPAQVYTDNNRLFVIAKKR
jgi:hypothetical protein